MFPFREFKFSTGKIKGFGVFFGESSHFFSKAPAQPQIQHTVKKPFQWSSFNQSFSLTYCSNWLHTSAKQLLFLLYKHLYFCCQCLQLRHHLHFSSDRCCVSSVWFRPPFPSDADHLSFFIFSGFGLFISLLFARVATNSKTQIHLSVCSPDVHLKVIILGGVWIWISLSTHGLGPIAPRDYQQVPFVFLKDAKFYRALCSLSHDTFRPFSSSALLHPALSFHLSWSLHPAVSVTSPLALRR